MFHLTLILKALECFSNKLEFYNQRFHKKNSIKKQETYHIPPSHDDYFL